MICKHKTKEMEPFVEEAKNHTDDGRFDFDKEISPASEGVRARIECTPDKYRFAVNSALYIMLIVGAKDNLDGEGKGLLNDIDLDKAPNIAKQFLSTVDKKYLKGIDREEDEDDDETPFGLHRPGRGSHTKADTVYKYM